MTNFIPIECLLSQKSRPDQPAFVRGDQIILRQQWLAEVQMWRARFASEKADRWALYHDDAGEFSVRLFALLSLGKTIYLPGSCKTEVTAQLADFVQAYSGNFDTSNQECSPIERSRPRKSPQDFERDQISLPILDTQSPLLKIFTSGSTGKPVAIAKSLSQLSAEVNHLEMLWGDQFDAENPLIVATVSHQHIYGLLFRVLWPLAAGRSFDVRCYEYMEELELRANQGWTMDLVSSPTHLSRLPLKFADSLVKQVHRIFSSGAPLAKGQALSASKDLQAPLVEIYGSSETGGIAWRQQSDSGSNNESPWQTMPQVSIKASPDQCLQLRSAHLPIDTDWYTTADRISFNADGRFNLLGRVDRIVKVEGKRLSLDELEAALCRHEFVDQAGLLMLEGRRDEIAAVLVLTTPGIEYLCNTSKKELNHALKMYLGNQFERVMLPRKWRYLQSLPRNTQGKLQQSLLSKLFKTEAASRLPIILESSQNPADKQVTLRFYIPSSLDYFNGHFDIAPVLPGVVLLQWAEEFASEYFSIERKFDTLETVKFKKIVVPDQELTLQLKLNAATMKINFSYVSASGEHSSGRISYSGSGSGSAGNSGALQ